MQNTSQLLLIFFYSFLTAIACGIGALPFFWWKNISKKGIGIAKSIAAGLMIAASFDLIQEGTKHSVWGVFFGILIGMGIIFVAKRVVERFESKITF